MERLTSLQEPPSAQLNLEVLRTYKWLLITTSLVGAIIAAISASGVIPIYRASAKLLIERVAPQVVKVAELLPTEDVMATDFYPTQYGILKSFSLARDVVTKLSLQQHPEFVGTPEEKSSGLLSSIQGGLRGLLGSIQGWVRGMLDGIGIAPAARQHPAVAIGPDAQEHQIVEAFLGRLRVDPVRNSRLVTISFDGRDPVLIAHIVNSLAEAYMNRTIELKLNAAQAAMQWLRDKVGEERQKIEQAERALQAFREQENILSAQGSEEVLVRKLAAFNDMYVQTRVKRLEIDSQVQMLQRIAKDPKMMEAFPLVMQNQFIQTLKANYSTLEMTLSELSDRYDFKHPAIQHKASQLNSLKGNVNQGIEQIRQSVEMQSQLAKAMEEYVRNLMDETKREAFAFHQKAIQYGVLQREVQAQNEVYTVLLKRLHETGMTDQLRVGNVSLIDPAQVPTGPVNAGKKKKILIGLLSGLGVGLGIAFSLNALNTTIRTPDDLEQALGLAFLGSIMRFQIPKKEPGRGELIVQVRSRSLAAEAFRNVRTSIMHTRSELPSKALLLTSVTPNEGKTVVAANLAVTLAQAGRTVLLVDTDMRKPRLGKLFHLYDQESGLVSNERREFRLQRVIGALYDERPGLIQVLRGDASLDEAIRPTKVERLSLIPCPITPAYPSELLESKQLAALIASAKERYDFVLLDSPPLMAVTDAVVLASQVDGVVLVIKGEAVPRELLCQAMAMLADVKATIVGCVLNMVDVRRDRSYYYRLPLGKYYGHK